ncbi:DUF3223 domain-containing protein [Anderseniella sp. Alg231-50]|uniref:DUF3223 domain-containing protein n=1 Tax=Anderseniella sp. Alg231-50 TaxID=1922226 RepID=UPI000D5596E4
MAKARKIVLETRSFNKVGEASEFFKEMLNSYSIGERASEEDAADLIALLNRHDQRIEKIGAGISYFEVGLPPEHPGKCFWIVRVDGSKMDFSLKHCLAPKPYD